MAQASVDSRMRLCLKVACQARDGHPEPWYRTCKQLEYRLLVFILSSLEDHQVKLFLCDVTDEARCQTNPQQHTALGFEELCSPIADCRGHAYENTVYSVSYYGRSC